MPEKVPMYQEGRLAGRIAVVTGSSTGNGRGIALALAAEGAAIVCADIKAGTDAEGYDVEPEHDTHVLIERRGGSAVFVEADVSDEAMTEALVERALETFGRIDIWVNNAGIGRPRPIAEESRADFDRTLAVNVTGSWLGCKAAARVMRSQSPLGASRGRIVNLGSICGEIGQGNVAAYSATKGAIHAMTRDLAVELAPDRINVNAVAPGFIRTRMSRPLFGSDDGLARIGAMQPWPDLTLSAGDVGDAVAFLASDAAAMITGVILPVDGGVLAA